MLEQASDTISIGSGSVGSGSVQVTKTQRQNLPSGPQDLIKWAEEHRYGPVTSYTNTPVANHFHVRLREPGELKEQPAVCHLPLPRREEGEEVQFSQSNGGSFFFSCAE